MAIKENLINTLKKAMQGEMDSVTLYKNAADHSSDEDVKSFFATRMEEEKQHYNYLLNYYKELAGDVEPTDLHLEYTPEQGFHPIITADFLRRIGGDQYLFSAISTALLLEKDAIDHYRKSMDLTDNLTLKSFFNLLVNWEQVHYDDLLKIQKEAEVYYWEINDFEPF